MPFEIVQVIQEFSQDGGAETVAWELQRAWDRAGVPSTVLASTVGASGAGPGAGTRMQRVAAWLGRVPTRGPLRHLGRLLVVPCFTFAATIALRRHRGGVILSHGDSFVGDVVVIHAVNAASLKSKREQGAWRWALNPMHLWVSLRDRHMIGGLRYRIYVALSERVRSELQSLYGVPADRIRIIPNGVPLERFKPDTAAGAAIRQELGIPPDAKVLLFCGHEFSRKGLIYAAGALGRLPDDTWLLVVGEDAPGPYRAAAGHSAGRMLFLGARSDMPALYSAADAFVLPTAYESFSLVCMEAMACATPVFATMVGGIEGYLVDGVNGQAIPRDADGLADVLRPILADPTRLRRLGEGAAATAQRFGWDGIAAEYAALLKEVWAAKTRPAPIDAPAPYLDQDSVRHG